MHRRQPLYVFTPGERRSRFSRFASLSLALYPTIFASRKIREASCQSQSMLMFFLDRAQHCTVHVILDYYNNIMRLFFFRLLDWVDRDSRQKKERIIVFKNMFNLEDFKVSATDKHSHQIFLMLVNYLKNTM